MLGSHAEPDEAVQETSLRLDAVGVGAAHARSHTAWTASFASLREPSIRHATACRRERWVSNRSVSQASLSIGHISASQRSGLPGGRMSATTSSARPTEAAMTASSSGPWGRGCDERIDGCPHSASRPFDRRQRIDVDGGLELLAIQSIASTWLDASRSHFPGTTAGAGRRAPHGRRTRRSRGGTRRHRQPTRATSDARSSPSC
jgi:hypothetical protein